MTIAEKKAKKAAYMKKYWFRKKMSKTMKAWWAERKMKEAPASKQPKVVKQPKVAKHSRSEAMRAYWAKRRAAAQAAAIKTLAPKPVVQQTGIVIRLGNEMRRLIEMAVQEELRSMGLTRKKKYHKGFKWYARYEKIVPKRILKSALR
jgi:hypothetical protein